MIKAHEASEITERAYIKQRDTLLQHINDMILEAANNGLSSCNISTFSCFDDTVKQALNAAGYHINYIDIDWGGFYKISWGDNKC